MDREKVRDGTSVTKGETESWIIKKVRIGISVIRGAIES